MLTILVQQNEKEIAVVPYVDLLLSIGWRARNQEEFATALKSSLFLVTYHESMAPDSQGPLDTPSSPRLVGAGRVVGDKYSATLFDLVVAPDAQRGGIGRSILSAVYEELARRGIPTLYCLADNPTSAAYYEHLGWESIAGFQVRILEDDVDEQHG